MYLFERVGNARITFHPSNTIGGIWLKMCKSIEALSALFTDGPLSFYTFVYTIP